MFRKDKLWNFFTLKLRGLIFELLTEDASLMLFNHHIIILILEYCYDICSDFLHIWLI